MNAKRYKADEDSRSVAVNLPLGFFDVEFRYGDSKYERLQHSIFGSYATWGNSTDQSLKIGRTLSRSKEGKTDLFLRVLRKDNENFIEGTKLEVNSKVYTDLVLGASRVEQLWGGSFYVDAQWTRGTQWLGANDVTMNAAGVTPALFYKYSGNLSWSRGFALGSRRIDLGLRSGWQWTSRNLLTANTLSIGDEYTVRGFKGNGAFGDVGGYLSTTVTVPIAGGWSAFTGIDYGALENNLPDARLQEMSGWAVGLRGNWRNASVSLMHAEPLTSPGTAKDPVLYGMASLRF